MNGEHISTTEGLGTIHSALEHHRPIDFTARYDFKDNVKKIIVKIFFICVSMNYAIPSLGILLILVSLDLVRKEMCIISERKTKGKLHKQAWE